MTVALTGRRADALNETLSMMEPSGSHVALPGDITDPQIRMALARYIHRWWGCLDVLVNNAGLISVGPLVRTSDDDLERLLATNV